MRRWIAIGLVVLVAGGIFVYNKFFKKSTDAPAGRGETASGNTQGGGPGQGGGRGGPGGGGPTTVSGFIVVEQPLRDEVIATGSLIPAEQVDIFPEVSGRITKLNIREGQPVAAGTLLLKLYDADLQAQLQRLHVQEENARRTEDRNKQLLTRGGISQQEYDIVVTNLKSALADIEVVKANLRRTEIRAPFSGVIGLRNVSLGAYVTPSTLIARLQQTASLKLDFSIPEKYGSVIRQGSSVSFTVDAYKKPFSGQVYAIEPSVEAATRNLRIRARVNNNQSQLRPGSFAKVTLTIKNERGLVVPTQAVIPQTRSKQVILVRNGKAVFQDVTTGQRSANTIQLLSGVQAGDTIATTGLLFLRPDAPVKITRMVKLSTIPPIHSGSASDSTPAPGTSQAKL